MDAPEWVIDLAHAPSGLRAFLVIDSTRLGPAAGGIRTRGYPSAEAARADAAALARAMTVKCALAGLAAGGGKCVVLDHPGLRREQAFAELGRRIEQLGGLFRTAGDLGTTAADLAVTARHTRHVHTEGDQLAAYAGRGLLRAAEACAEALGAPGVAGLTVLVQGAGTIGAAAARALAGAGARVQLCDLDGARAARVAAEVGAAVVPAEDALRAEVDLLAPCAVGGVIDVELARRLRARALCGGANNILVDDAADAVLHERGIVHVPDVLASAGAVAAGIGRSVMGLADPTPLVDALGTTARTLLARARAEARPSGRVARELAAERLRP